MKFFYTSLLICSLASCSKKSTPIYSIWLANGIPFVAQVGQSLRFLKAHPKFDGTNLFTIAKSQGSGLAIIAAGLDKDVKDVAASVPALSDHRSYLLGVTGGWPFLNNYNVNQYEQLAGTMAYYDSAYFAELTTAPVTMGVGLLDKTTPPPLALPPLIVFQHQIRSFIWKQTLGTTA